jgi:TldD protein
MTLTLLALLLSTAVAAEPDPVLQAMDAELVRAQEALASQENAPYFIGLEAIEIRTLRMHGEEGGLQGYGPNDTRWIHADVRVGAPNLDSTHPLRDFGWDDAPPAGREMGLGDDPDVLQAAVWREIDARYRVAADRYQRVLSDQQLLVEETLGADLSAEVGVEDLQPAASLSALDLAGWEDTLRRASAVFATSDITFDAGVTFIAEAETRWFVSSEGHRLRHGAVRLRVIVQGDTLAEDGDGLVIARTFDAATPEGLPSADEVIASAEDVQRSLTTLKAAPLQEPYRGPAILSGRASAVFFHEIFGHRVEGHRLRLVDDAQTFRQQVGQPILPTFLSVVDDPTRAVAQGEDLRGHFAYDDQGVKAQPATLVRDGVLEGFLENRSPVQAEASNGHGRRQAGHDVVTRQGNLVVEAAKTVDDATLRAKLIAEAKKQGLDYALIVDDIDGGFTFTGRDIPNAFQIDVIEARQVFVDGRPDLIVRGIDLIGTPLQTFSRILAAGPTPAVFNGTCGAESGWVPVSAVSPALLVQQIETQRKLQGQARQPVTGPPSDVAVGDEPLLDTLVAMADRAKALQLDDLAMPSRVTIAVRDGDVYTAAADRGSALRSVGNPGRPARVEVVVSDGGVSSARIDAGGIASLPDAIATPRLVVDDEPLALARDLWVSADDAYKSALQRLSFKKAALARTGDIFGPDWSPAEAVDHRDAAARSTVDRGALEALARDVSAPFKEVDGLTLGHVQAAETQGREYLVDTDGMRLVQNDGYAAVHARAELLRPDGMSLHDERFWVARTAADLPDAASMAKATRQLGLDLAARSSAKSHPWYEGPVVFEGEAAADVFRYLLPSQLRGTPPEPSGDREYQVELRSGPRLGRRVLPEGWTVRDDPTTAPSTLPGGYGFDREGVPGQRVDLVADGRVSDLVMSRVPRGDRVSNGHARGSVQGRWVARLAHWTVAPEKLLGDGAFERKVKSLTRAAGVDRVLVVKRLERGWAGGLPRPTHAVWRFGDGREEPVLALEFQGVDRRTLRDLVAASGTQVRAYLASRSGHGRGGSVSGLPVILRAPSKILLEEIEAVEPGPEQEPPSYPAP